MRIYVFLYFIAPIKAPKVVYILSVQLIFVNNEDNMQISYTFLIAKSQMTYSQALCSFSGGDMAVLSTLVWVLLF